MTTPQIFGLVVCAAIIKNFQAQFKATSNLDSSKYKINEVLL